MFVAFQDFRRGFRLSLDGAGNFAGIVVFMISCETWRFGCSLVLAVWVVGLAESSSLFNQITSEGSLAWDCKCCWLCWLKSFRFTQEWKYSQLEIIKSLRDFCLKLLNILVSFKSEFHFSSPQGSKVELLADDLVSWWLCYAVNNWMSG